jgi:L-fuculose-phosphate aldolase
MTKTVTTAEELCAAGRRLAELGYVAGSDGNLSARLGDNRIIITPSGAVKGDLTPDDLITVNSQSGMPVGPGQPSSESAMHLAVYRQRPDIGACVHSHPPYTTAHAVAGIGLEADILPEVVVFVGPIALTDYAPPGTAAVGASLAPFLADHNAFVLRNHGLLTIGRTVREALHRHETVEHFARICFLARQLGGLSRIPKEDYARLMKIRQSMPASLSGAGGE